MRAVFLGTPEFAVPSLRAMAAQHDVVAVFTQPDRPKGRGNQLAESPVKQTALELGIPVYQPDRIRKPDSVEFLRSLAIEIMIVVGYGQIIPQTIIDLSPHGILNVHASLLPKYRGAAPIQWAIANGETRTGVTIMRIDAGLDTGDMLTRAAVDIQPDETAAQLIARLAPLGADLLINTILEMPAPEKQNNAEATLARILKKEDGLIDWNRKAADIYNRFRGFNPWPGAYTWFRGLQLTIVGARPVQTQERKKWIVRCGDNTLLELTEVQLAGKKRMSGDAFLNGYKVDPDEPLGMAS